jgi:hypothetical protein
MKTASGNAPVFQGDLMFLPVPKLPKGAVPRASHIVAHSDSGHHHTVKGGQLLDAPGDDPRMVFYLQVGEGGHAEVDHLRPVDQHEAIAFTGEGAVFQVRRQREMRPDGWARVED